MPTPDDEHELVDVSEALEMLEELRETLVSLDGIAPAPLVDNNKVRARHNAQRTRELLYAGHLCDKLKVTILDEYYVFRGLIK